MPRVRNWRVRYAWAPSSTAAPMVCMFSVPGSAAEYLTSEEQAEHQDSDDSMASTA